MNRIHHDNAAYSLTGRVLKQKWYVKKRLEPSQFSTGGNFSVCYIVEDNDGIAFLKALDFKQFMNDPNQDMVTGLNNATNCFLYEKNLLSMCSNKKFSKVSYVLDEGEEYVANHSIPKVPYLIFELADGDVRNHLSFTSDVDLAWKLRSLHNISTGLMQLHSIEVTHQDLKPSNVLLYEGEKTSKIGDLGRAICKNLKSPYDTMPFSGDNFYAPIEILYGHYESEWAKRVYLTDAYMLGSMATFYVSGMNINALMFNHLNDTFKPWNWGGDFKSALSYILDAFYLSIEEIKINISNERIANDLAFIIQELCYPDPEKRCLHYSKGKINSLILQRVVSAFNRIAFFAEINLIK